MQRDNGNRRISVNLKREEGEKERKREEEEKDSSWVNDRRIAVTRQSDGPENPIFLINVIT